MSKWQKIDPDEIKVGDRVRLIDKWSDEDAEYCRKFTVTGEDEQRINGYDRVVYDRGGWAVDRTWYIAKPKKAKPDSELADGHSAHYWRNRYNKQLDHNKQLEASNAGRRVKMQRLEKEAKDARHSEIKWASRYAALAASINELPKKPTPPTRPDEPPVGSFFRVDRTEREFYRFPQVSLTNYFHIACDAGDRPWAAWSDITEPGDTLTMLELREVGK